jgi:Polyketide cyclase / dehydrase and lipid transport
MSNGGRTVVVDNAVDISRSAENVFDYCTDLSRESEWNPKTRRIENLTTGPIGLGTRYEGEWIKGDPMRIEYVRFDRPTAWASVGRSRRLNARSEGHVSKTRQGVRLRIRMELQPRGAMRLLLPLLGPVMRRREERNVAAIKAVLEERQP